MPQKRNPDVLELVRGKTARVMAAVPQILILLKGLPLAYNRDLQEDKERVFDSTDTVEACLELAAAVVEGAELNRERIAERLDHGYLDATTLMEHLIKRGVPTKNLKVGDPVPATGSSVRRTLTLATGIPPETARKIQRAIKDGGFKKVQASIQGDELRVSSPSRDALQEVIAFLKGQDFDVELQFGNYRG